MYNSASLKNEAVSGATEDSSFDVSEEVEGKKQEGDAGAEEEILQKTVIGLFFVGFCWFFFLSFVFPETSPRGFSFFCVCSLSLAGRKVEVGQDEFSFCGTRFYSRAGM